MELLQYLNENLVGILSTLLIIVMFVSMRFAFKHYVFKRYAENFIKLRALMDEAYSTRLYNRLAIIRVENNGGIPKLGHSVYFTVIDERYEYSDPWRLQFDRWRIDHSAAKLLLEAYSVESSSVLLEDLDGTFHNLVVKDLTIALGAAVVYQDRKELYLLIATYNPNKMGLAPDDFKLQALRIRQLFLNR